MKEIALREICATFVHIALKDNIKMVLEKSMGECGLD
jgi:hypothetical protein